MPNTAIIHLGFPKTGSSSVQKTFSLNRRVLEAAGWRYARFTQYGRDGINHSLAFANLFAQHSQELLTNLKTGKNRAEQVARFRAEMAQNLACDLPLIFSGENICGMGVPALKAMQAVFDKAGRDLRIIGYLRPPTEYAESLIQQFAKDGVPGLGLKRPLDRFLSARVQRIRGVFPEAEFYPFDLIKAHAGGPAGFLADLIDPGLSEKLVEYRANARISANAVELLRHLNRQLPFFLEDGTVRTNPLRLHGDARPLFGLSGDRFHLPAQELAGIADQIAVENAWLEKHLGTAFCDRPGGRPDSPLAWRPEQAVELRRVLRRMPEHMRIVIASYFADRPDLPPELQALSRRYRVRGSYFLRLSRGGPGIGRLEHTYRKLRRQW